MSKKTIMDLLLAFSSIGGNEYSDIPVFDEKVNECLMDMYFYMLYNGDNNETKKEEYFHEFENKYNKLNEKQQEEVRKEYKNIIETQKKNREKVKRKGMIENE